MKNIFLGTFGFLCFCNNSRAQFFSSIETNTVWQTRNEFRVPGTTGTRVDLSEIKSGPFWGYRVYAGKRWNERHEIRALYAPLSVRLDTALASPVNFQETSFSGGVATQAFYKFNSYRLGYTYFFESVGDWNFGLGFTAKIRDAEIRLTQGATTASKKNVGFVPLMRFQSLGNLGEHSKLRFDVDGLGAPQGRAIDATLRYEHYLGYFGAGHSLWGFLGYRTVEGGADNAVVYSFAWFHALAAGLYAEF